MSLSDVERMDRAMSEDQLLSAVMAAARWQRWLAYHIRNSRAGVTQGDTGYPDVTAIRPPRLIVAELKRETEDLTPAQRRWHDAFREVAEAKGIEVYVWRPSDLRSGLIERTFR